MTTNLIENSNQHCEFCVIFFVFPAKIPAKNHNPFSLEKGSFAFVSDSVSRDKNEFYVLIYLLCSLLCKEMLHSALALYYIALS